jgi:hypothetical protein
MSDVFIAVSTNGLSKLDRRRDATPEPRPYPRLSSQGWITEEDSHSQVVKGADPWRIGETRNAKQNLSNEEALGASKEPTSACIQHHDAFGTVHEKSLILFPSIVDESELAEKVVARLSELNRRNLRRLKIGAA